METREDLENELQSRLEVASNSTKFPAARKTSLIQNAYLWITDIFNWVELSTAKLTNTIANHDYYDQPAEYKSGSIYRLEINGEKYDRKNYEDYLDYKLNNPTSTKKIFACLGKQFFVSPTPTTNGTDNISLWGIAAVDGLPLSTSKTVFSEHRTTLNECIVKKAFSVATIKTNSSLSKAEEKDAIALATQINAKEWEGYQRDQRIQHPQFSVPNFFAPGSVATPIGGFNYDPSSEFN